MKGDNMAKCCDRCEKPINRNEMAVIKFQFNFREYVRSISEALRRKREGLEDYKQLTATGKWELCEDCREELSVFMLDKSKSN
jgi:hypothetical protein